MTFPIGNEKRRKWELVPGMPTKYSLLFGLALMVILYGHLSNLPILVSCTVVLSLLYCLNFIVTKGKRILKKMWGSNSAASTNAYWSKRRQNWRSPCKQFCHRKGGGDWILSQDQNYLVNALIVGFVFLSILPSPSNASPTRSPDTCGLVGCPADSGDARDLKFEYKAGGVYNYLYTVNGTVLVDGSTRTPQSGLHFSANTTIHFLTACDAILYMKDVELWQSVLPSGQDDIHKHSFTHARTSQTFKESLEQFPLRFSYVDGEITEICPDPTEAGWVLNIKRGLLSSFQNTMRRLDLELKSYENDVHGRCQVEYRIGEATSSNLTITKTKDLNSCGDKFGSLSAIRGSPYHFGALHQSMPAVESFAECSQIVDRNLIVEVQCDERHRLKPLSDGTSGVHVILRQHLDLITMYGGGNSTEEDDSQSNKENDDDDDGFGLGLDDDEEEEDEEDESPGSNQKASASRVENAGSFLIILSKPYAYITEIISTSPKQVSRRASLVFHHDYHVGSSGNDYKAATNALYKFCQAVKNNVDETSGALLEALIATLRGLSASDMVHLSREAARYCEGDRSLFDNALESVGTAASVGVIKERILSKDAPRERISSWINSLTFIPKPDLDLMVAAYPLLLARENNPNILLSYSALAHSFCRQHTDCSQHKPVQILGNLYEKFFNLTGCVTKQRKDVDKALVYLKGIGNFGKFDDGIHTALQTCMEHNDQSEIRVATIEAYRRMSCSEIQDSSVHEEMKRIFENQEDDTEVRIAAFLTLMRCPTYPTIRWLKRVMGKEEIRQVTSFVSSNIRNLQESSLPSKLELQGLVADEKFNDPYHTDFRQFSKNFEASAFYPDGNFGMGLESNLIFSQESYIPRSSSLNLTVDLFGESINLFEITLRTQNFEHYVESIFGPNGKLSKPGISKFLSSLRRQKRAVPAKRKMRTLALEYDAMKRYYSDPIMSVSLKTLGSETDFIRKVGLDELSNSLNGLNPMHFLDKYSKTKDLNLQKSTMLFDSSYIIPTGVGLPLNLSAQASGIMRFQAESLIDTTNFRANPFQLKLKGKLVPSAMLTASAGVSLSAFQSHAGMKVRAHLRSSTAVEGHLEISGAELLDVGFGIPKSKLELLEFKSDILFLEKEEYKAVPVTPAATKRQSCNTGILYKYMGLKLCTSSHFTLPKSSSSVKREDDVDERPTLLSSLPFLLNGPSHFSLSVDKANPSLLKTRFHYQWNSNETSTEFKLRTIRTTGTVTSPKEDELGIAYLLDKAEKSLNVDVNFPGSTATLNGQLKNENVALKLDVSDKLKGRPYMGFSVLLDTLSFPDIVNEAERPSGSSTRTVGTSQTYSGSGDAFYKEWQMTVALQGARNATHFSVDCKGSYKPGGPRSSSLETISLQLSATNQEKRRHGQLLGTNTDTTMAVDFSQYPDYNTLLVWKSQISEEGYQNDVDFRQGRKYLTDSDPTTFRIQARAHHEADHKKRGVKWTFFATQPSQGTDWGVEVSFNSHGKSFDSAISVRYAPERTYGTSLSLTRKPGVMLFLDSQWSLTIPGSRPLLVSLHIDEQAPRIYQIQYKLDWFGSNHLNLDVELTDRSRRNKIDTSVWLTLTTKSIDGFKLGVDYLSEERETKLQLKSEYENQRHAFEVGHRVNGGSKHKLYVMVETGGTVYLVMSEMDLEYGVQCSLQTDLGPNFSAFHIRVKATNQNGLRTAHFAYNWDRASGVRDTSKQFLFEVSLDSSKPFLHRFEGMVTYPGYNYYCEGHYRYSQDDRSRVVMGRLKWKDDEHLHVNAQLVPRISAEEKDDHEAYDVLLEVATPFELVKNLSLNAGIDLFNQRDQCVINLNATWGEAHKLGGRVETKLESLQDFSTSADTTSVQNANESPTRIPFKFTLRGNLSSTVEGLETLRVTLFHSQYNHINSKTDMDIQLPNEKEISMMSQLIIPDSFADLLSTQIELHIKTPFVGFQNLDAQAILGRREDKDVVALIGIYIENIQYSLTVTGTPRFEEDGALGFVLTTSNPKYDKIFGSFSYVIGDNSRLACQLGWPQDVISLEAGLESGGWEEFQVYLTFTTPWMPVKNINAAVKIDTAQFAELKLELNEDEINAKSEWVIESWTSFAIRLDGNTLFQGTKTFGGILKNAWDDPDTYHSEALGWIDEHQAGFKLEGGKMEKEEECGFATVMHGSFQVDTVVYPTIRSTFNYENMDIKHNVTLSLLLREGPINVIMETEALDVLRFNDKILITTPYPGLFQLEINLNPAIVIERGLYNLQVHSKWRSGSTWEEGGLVVRHGPQSVYADLVSEDRENAEFLQCNPPAENEDGDEGQDYGGGGGGEGETTDIPGSQLFHFYSPLKWANVVKLEYQLVPKSPDSDVDGKDETLYQDSLDDPDSSVVASDYFPLQTLALVYQGANASITTDLKNGAERQSLTGRIDVPTWTDRISLELDSSLDRSTEDWQLSIRGMSHYPSKQEYSVMSNWNNQLPNFLNVNVDLNTPIDKLEQQSASVMYAHNEQEGSYTVDLEINSVLFEKLSTNVAFQPSQFTMTLSTPFENYKDLELNVQARPLDDNPEAASTKQNILVTYKNGEDEVEVDLESEIENDWPSKITGTVLATIGPDSAQRGTVKATSEKHADYRANGDGELEMEGGRKISGKIDFDFPVEDQHLKHLKLQVNTTFNGFERWIIDLNKNEDDSGGNRMEYTVTGIYPLNRVSESFSGGLLLEKQDSWLDVTALRAYGQSPSGSFSADSSWLLEKWNNFEVNTKAKYKLDLGEELRSSSQFLLALPESNSFGLSIGNRIPTLARLSLVDSKIRFKIQEPSMKLGQSIQIKYRPEEMPTFALKSSTVSENDVTDVNVDATFNDDFDYFGGTAKYKASGTQDHVYQADCKWEKVQESFDGEAQVVWGSETLGNTSIHSTFNCSVNEASERVLHVRLGSPVVTLAKQSESSQQEDAEEQEPKSQQQHGAELGADGETSQQQPRQEGEGNEDTPNTPTLANPLVNPMVTIDGTFNKTSGRHSARIQVGQLGMEKPPIVTEAEIFFVSFTELDLQANFSSGIENLGEAGIVVSHTIQEWGKSRNVLDGTYGGHWEGNEASIKYAVRTENQQNLQLYNVSLFGVIPISTEANPKPQRAGVDVFYKTEEPMMLETAFRGEYNGVQLLKINYKSDSLSSAGLEKENTQLEVDNHFWPFGFNHTYQFEYSGGSDGSNLPTKTIHNVDLHSLKNPEQDKFEGEMEIYSNFTGEKITLQGAHPSRKVYLITDYNSQDQQFQHSAQFSWKEDSALGYELVLMNMTNENSKVDHRLSLKLNYPIRVIHLDTGYTFHRNTFEWTTAVNLNASRTQDKMESKLEFSLVPLQSTDKLAGKATATLKHPLLDHDIIAAGELTMVGLTTSSSSPGRGRIEGIFSLEYSDDPTQRLILNWDAKLDLREIVYGSGFSSSPHKTSLLPYWHVESNGKLEHLATNLGLKALCSTQHSPHELSIIALMDFKNSVKNVSQESKMAFELLKKSKEASLQMSDPEGYALLWSQLTGQYPQFVVNGKCNVTGISPAPVANISLDFAQPYFRMYAVHGKELMDGIFGEGGVVDSRNVYFDLSQSYDNFRFSDVNFYLRLNHSRLITSKLQWRPELFADIRDLCINLYRNGTAMLGAKWNRICEAAKQDAKDSMNSFWAQLKPNVHNFVDAVQEDTNFSVDLEALKTFFVEMYENNELHLRDIHDYLQLAAEEITARIKKSFERYQRDLTSPGKLFEKAYSWVVEQVHRVYQHVITAWKNYVSSSGEGISATWIKIKQLFFLWINDALEMAEHLIYRLYQSLSDFAAEIYAHIAQWVEKYQPVVMAYIHKIEKTVYGLVNKVLDFFYETKEAVQKSPYYQKLAKLAEDVDAIYKDISKNDFETNFRKYYGMLKEFFARKLEELQNLHLSLGKTGEKLVHILKGAMETEVMQDLKGALLATYENVKALVEYMELDVYIPKVLLTLVSKGNSIFFWTAVDNAASFQQAKTKFYFEPKKGIVSLEQKLPMPVAAFNETPIWSELPEYRAVAKVQELFQGSNDSYWMLYSKLAENPFNILPPFEGHAMVVGSSNFFTFDGLIYNHRGLCVHLLTADLVDGNFSVSLQYEASSSSSAHRGSQGEVTYNIIVASGHNTLIIDMKEDGIKDPKRGLQQSVSLPIQMANLQGYREAEMLIVESPKGLTVSCNAAYQLCQIKVSGWYSRKVAGVLGTMDMEPFTDLTVSTGKHTSNLSDVFSSWDVSDDSFDGCSEVASSTEVAPISPSAEARANVNYWCNRIFQSKKHSSLQSCFSTVDVQQFFELCMTNFPDTPDSISSSVPPISICNLAMSYSALCRSRGVRVKIPSGCIRCELDGETMLDRDMKVISSPPAGSPPALSTDVVFIVEAKDCNRALRTKRKIDSIALALEEELTNKGFKNNRYAMVVFGGDGVYDKPHSVVQKGEIFAKVEDIGIYTQNVTMGNGNNDTFQAIWFALHNLLFRPGVSKTFILFPCTGCSPSHLSMDFSSIHYAMLEQDAKLHILMNREFLFDDKSLAKRFFGYDASLGYTKSDGMKNRLRGDAKIRHQVFLPKRILGYCAPLALETNGTIFSGKKLQNRREKIVQVFTTVFSRRVVQTATPAECQTCYCLPNDDNGIGKIECFVCSYPRYKPLPEDYDDPQVHTPLNSIIPEDEDDVDTYDEDEE